MQDTDSVCLATASENLDDLVRPGKEGEGTEEGKGSAVKRSVVSELLEEWLRTKPDVFVTRPEDRRRLGLWKVFSSLFRSSCLFPILTTSIFQVEMEGDSVTYLSNKLYSFIDTRQNKVKRAARGAQMRSFNADLLMHSSYFEALQRPERFEEYLRERRLRVEGKGMLGLVSGVGEEEERAEPSRRKVVQLRRGRQFNDWLQQRETQRLLAAGHQPRPFPLLAQNSLITRNTENILISVLSHKSLMTGLTAKRLLLPNSWSTCPLPETSRMQVRKD